MKPSPPSAKSGRACSKGSKMTGIVTRRGLLAAVLSVPAVARAQSRSVRVIVAYGAGGTADTTARILFSRLNDVLGQQFVIENRPGAAGTLAASAVARAMPDGTTLLHDATAHSVNPSLFPRLPYDTRKDFAPVFHAMVTPSTLLANNLFAAKTVPELIAMAKAAPGSIDCASPGIGSLQHMSLELLNRLAGIRINHIPYREVAAGRNDVVAGRIPIMFSNVPGSMLFLGNGQARTLAHGGAEATVAVLPGVPAMKDSVPGFESYEWNGVFAPAGTPAAEIRRLNEGLNKVIAEPATAERMAAIGCLVRPNTPEQFAASLDAEIEKWGRIVREGNIRIE